MQGVVRQMIVGVLLSGLVSSPVPAETASDVFFRPAPNAAREYDPNKLFPQGRIFPVGFYGLNLQRDMPEGLTLIGPYGGDQNIASAKRYGLSCTYTISLPMDFHSEKPLDLSSGEIYRRIREQVEAVAEHSEIAWWYLAPEELRYWRKKEITYLEVAADAIRETDPLKRPVWMYDPGHRNAAGLAHTVQHLDICGKGMYTNYSGQRENRVWVRWTIEQEIKAIEQEHRSAIPIAVPEMFQQPPDEFLSMIPTWVRHDVYLSLMSGAKGIVIFSGWRRPKFPAFDRYHEAYAECIRELTGPLNLGQVFLFGERRNDITVRVIRGPSHVATAHKEPVRYPAIALLDVAHDNDRYLFLANSSNEAIRVEVCGLPATPIRAEKVFNTGQTEVIGSGQWKLNLDALEVKAFRIKPG